jgi:hypothetical protein
MDSNSLVVLASVLGTLTAIGALGTTGLVAAAYANERGKRQAAERERDALKLATAELKAEVKRLTFLRGNKLYSRAEQDLGFAASQSVIRLRVIKAQVDEELTVIEKMLDTSKGTK